jgi:hypothetical protein
MAASLDSPPVDRKKALSSPGGVSDVKRFAREITWRASVSGYECTSALTYWWGQHATEEVIKVLGMAMDGFHDLAVTVPEQCRHLTTNMGWILAPLLHGT